MIVQILLAAGRSSRMGHPKALLDLGGVPLLERIVRECRVSGVDEVLVVLGHERDRILREIDLSGTRLVVNDRYDRGQASSLHCALEALPPGTRAFLNLAADHPFVTRRDIDALIAAWRGRGPRDPARIFVPVHNGRAGKPVLFDISLRREILGVAPGEPVEEVIARDPGRVRRVEVANPLLHRDVDTPRDLAECRAILGRGGGERS